MYAHCFDAAQLDGNTETLYDGRGGGADTTIAVAALEAAIASAKGLVGKIDTGELTATSRTLSAAQPTGSRVLTPVSSAAVAPAPGSYGGSQAMTPNGTYVDGSEGFLFKPVTNNEGRAAVLLGSELTGHIMSVLLKDKDGNTIEQGQQNTAGIAETGREKWTFTRKGDGYGKDITVEVQLDDGSIRTYQIPNPSQRYD